MSDREIDQQLVERAQRGDKHAFELLVSKYQRKLGRLLSRFIRDATEVEDVTQEAFIKAYRALPTFRGDSAFYTWLYRIGINTAKNYLVAMGRRAPTTTDFDSEEAESFEDGDQLRDLNTPENQLMSRQVAETVNQTLEQLPEEFTGNSFEVVSSKGNFLNVKINDNKKPSDVLQELLNHQASIISFNEVLPSLNEIFIRQVQELRSEKASATIEH